MKPVQRLTKEKAHEYWKQPWDGANRPRDYKEGSERSRFLVDLVKNNAPSNARILEIGCNIGRNLDHLLQGGFRKLEGIEISEAAVREMKEAYPALATAAKIHVGPIEEILPRIPDAAFDVTFSMAVLEHIHEDSEWVFPHIVRITRGTLITIEDEKNVSERHFPRNYRKVFVPLGMKQVKKISGRRIEGLRSGYFVARVFRRS